MMPDDQTRNIVVLYKGTDKLVRLCSSWDSYDSWIEDSDYSEKDLKTYEALVH